MAEANVCQRVHAVFMKNKAYLRGVIKEGLSSFLDNQDFLTETEKLAPQDVSIDENKRLGDLMEIIEKRISEKSDFFSTVLSCLKDSRYNLDNIKKEIEEARETALSAHSSISGSTESCLDQSNASFDGNVIPQPITRCQSTGDIPFRDFPTTFQISPSHQKGVRKRPSSASEKYLSPYASSGSSKKVSTPSRPGSGQRKQGGTPNVSPVRRSQSSGSSASPLESPMSQSGSLTMGTIIENPAEQRKTCESMPQNEEEDNSHEITTDDIHVEASMLSEMEQMNNLVECARDHDQLVTGSTHYRPVYTSALDKCGSLVDYYEHKIDQVREEAIRVQREQAREIDAQCSNVREAENDLRRLINEREEILRAQQEEVQELHQEINRLSEVCEQSDAEKEDLKCRLAQMEKRVYKQDQKSYENSKQIRVVMQDCGIPEYDKNGRLEAMEKKWKAWKKVGEDIITLRRGEVADINRHFILQAVVHTRNIRRPSTI